VRDFSNVVAVVVVAAVVVVVVIDVVVSGDGDHVAGRCHNLGDTAYLHSLFVNC